MDCAVSGISTGHSKRFPRVGGGEQGERANVKSSVWPLHQRVLRACPLTAGGASLRLSSSVWQKAGVVETLACNRRV